MVGARRLARLALAALPPPVAVVAKVRSGLQVLERRQLRRGCSGRSQHARPIVEQDVEEEPEAKAYDHAGEDVAEQWHQVAGSEQRQVYVHDKSDQAVRQDHENWPQEAKRDAEADVSSNDAAEAQVVARLLEAHAAPGVGAPERHVVEYARRREARLVTCRRRRGAPGTGGNARPSVADTKRGSRARFFFCCTPCAVTTRRSHPEALHTSRLA